MKNYAQYCPIARTSEVLAQRWMPIIVRDLLHGPISYSELADGAPGLSRTLLTSRLRELERLELVERDQDRRYSLTAAGRSLGDVIEAMGAWGERWLDVTQQHADPGYVLNSWVGSHLATDRLPDERVVVRFRFRDQPAVKAMWVIFDGPDSEVCRRPPGFEDDLTVDAESVALAEWHLGRIEWAEALRRDRIAVEGSRRLASALPTWNRRSPWVSADHPEPQIT